MCKCIYDTVWNMQTKGLQTFTEFFCHNKFLQVSKHERGEITMTHENLYSTGWHVKMYNFRHELHSYGWWTIVSIVDLNDVIQVKIIL